MRFRTILLFGGLLLPAFQTLYAGRIVTTNPVFVAGNPSCSSLGYQAGYKPQPEPPPSGTYTFPGTTKNVTLTNDGTYVDWTSELGIDAVILKGGPNANLYVYDPPTESFSDNDLHAPINPNNSQPFGISHVEFCYDYEVDVSKTAVTYFTRTWTWTIDKSADQSELTLSSGQLFDVNYEVTVDATSADTDWGVSGTITIFNDTPLSASITDVSDVVSDAGAATVDCGSLFPIALAAGETLKCTYETTLPDASERTNTATVTTSGGVGGGTGTAPVAFDDTPDTSVDACIDVSDTNIGSLGTVCADAAPKTFTYSLTFGEDVELLCGGNTHTNTASFTTDNSGTTGSDSWTVDATVACETGCTLTPGYWKTHSQQGPAPYDDNWVNLGPTQEATVFYLSGKTYYQALWTPPAGNAYYILAHAYIAAVLNQLNGASVPAPVQTALTTAAGLFGTYTPAQVAAMRSTNAVRQQFVNLARTLDDYNNGLTGPGHCSEQTVSSTNRVAAPQAEAAMPEALDETPTEFTVSQYPNPFNPVTTIRLQLPENGELSLVIYDALGRVVTRLAEGPVEAGTYDFTWNAADMPSGLYFFQVRTGRYVRSQSMVLLK